MHDLQAQHRWDIQELKHTYARCVDTRDWAGLAATLAPEMTAQFRPDWITDGADALITEMEQRLTADRITAHWMIQPTLEIDGDTARGTWTMADRTICTDIGYVIEGQSLSHDEYRRDPERGWLITSITYQRVYEARMSLADTPSFQVTTTPFDLLAPR
ncbi:nuclear transport factor 2 family protein [Nocardioides sambongensis]|uniref:nuclear transport factor 2 family protein n=1 Tax=Nocardioides sambongensis TaxID=2589074 RepID=UPI00112CF0BA|nr:nuclear transport factor 2 family protein [Nocardioides sambongensis]